MESYFFHQMPWSDYPEDFDEKYESSSGTFPNSFFDPVKGAELYNRYLDELEYADALGYDGICLNEEHQNAFGGLMPSPNIVAGMLARRTKNAKIAILGNCLPLRANPLRVAEEIAMLDVTTRGRIISGFVRGAGCEYFCTDTNPTFSREMFYEAHDLIIRAWTEPGPFEYLGTHFQYRYVNLWPRPYTKPHPPVWLPSAGSSESVEFAARHRYPFVPIIAPLNIVKRMLDSYRDSAREKFGYDPEPSLLGYGPLIYVADDDQKAREEAAQHEEFATSKGYKMPLPILFPPGYVSDKSMRAFLAARAAYGSEGQVGSLGPSYVGSPRTVIDALIADYDFLGGFGFIIPDSGPGNVTHEQTIRNMTLFQNEVMPALKKYHAQRGNSLGVMPSSL